MTCDINEVNDLVVYWCLQDYEADAVWPSVSVSAYQQSAVNNAADFYVDDAVNEMTVIAVSNIHGHDDSVMTQMDRGISSQISLWY